MLSMTEYDDGRREYTQDGEVIATYYPEVENELVEDLHAITLTGKKGYKEYISFNPDIFESSEGDYEERAKPEYKRSVQVLLNQFRGCVFTEHMITRM